MSRKGEEKRHRDTEGETHSPIGALIRDEEPSGKKKREQRKKQEAGFQPNYLGPFGRILRPAGIIR